MLVRVHPIRCSQEVFAQWSNNHKQQQQQPRHSIRSTVQLRHPHRDRVWRVCGWHSLTCTTGCTPVVQEQGGGTRDEPAVATRDIMS